MMTVRLYHPEQGRDDSKLIKKDAASSLHCLFLMEKGNLCYILCLGPLVFPITIFYTCIYTKVCIINC